MCCGVYQNCLYGIAGRFPMKYTNAVIVGSVSNGSRYSLCVPVSDHPYQWARRLRFTWWFARYKQCKCLRVQPKICLCHIWLICDTAHPPAVLWPLVVRCLCGSWGVIAFLYAVMKYPSLIGMQWYTMNTEHMKEDNSVISIFALVILPKSWFSSLFFQNVSGTLTAVIMIISLLGE